MYRNN